MTHPDEYIDLQEDFNELLGWYREDQKKIILLQATADRRLALLREAQYFLEFVPIGMSDRDIVEYYALMQKIEKELSDG